MSLDLAIPDRPPMFFLGLDPGKKGCMAVVTETGTLCDLINFGHKSVTEHTISEWLEGWEPLLTFAVLERAGAMPGQGVTSMFNFGNAYGFIRGLLTRGRIPFEYRAPLQWQGLMHCKTGGDKAVTKAAAERIFPRQGVVKRWTLDNADAPIIAEYCRRWRMGCL